MIANGPVSYGKYTQSHCFCRYMIGHREKHNGPIQYKKKRKTTETVVSKISLSKESDPWSI